MNIGRIFPQRFSTRLITMTFIAGVIPVIVFGILISVFGNRFVEETGRAIRLGQDEQLQRSKAVLAQIAENIIRQKALDVALQIELYLLAHPHADLQELQNNREFRDIVIQPVGKTGYTAVHDSDSAVNLFHPDSQVENTELRTLASTYPEFWSIIADSMNSRYSNGYYSWPQADGTERRKYMYIAPVENVTVSGRRLSIGATTYLEEFTRSIQAAQDVSSGTTHFLMMTINRLTDSMRIAGFSFLGISAVLSLTLASIIGIYFSRAIMHLREATRKVNKGNFTIGDPPFVTGDLGNLVDDFHTMVDHLANTTVEKVQLEKKEKELQTSNESLQLEIKERKLAENEVQRYQQELERLVEERTKELRETNTLLLREVDERRQVEEALRLNEQRTKAILQASPIGIGLVSERVLSWANDMMYHILGYAPGTLLGEDARLLYPDLEEYERVGKELYDRLDKSEVANIFTQWVRKDGSVFDCHLRACPLDENDHAKGILVAVNDISEAKRLEKKLRHAQKMEAIGTLAGGVAHDLNNILSGIVTYPEIMLLDMEEDHPLKVPLNMVKKSGEQAAAVVQDLLTLARRGVAAIDVVNINRVIEDQISSPEISHITAPSRNISLHMELEDYLKNIKGSSAHLAKSLMNLIHNAAEAMQDGGQISISTHNLHLEEDLKGFEKIKAGEYVTLTVADEGSGISSDDLSQIFEPFYTTKKMGRSGSGLGMAVVWGTVRDHNGYIDIRSEVGKGTSISLYFPATSENISPAESTLSLDKYYGNGETILVVDDSESQRVISCSLLEKLRYTPTAVSSGEEAIDLLYRKKFDLVILDMVMEPGMDGLETYKQMIQIVPKTRVVIASGFSESARVREIQKLSGCEYIRKPYTLERIGEVLFKELR